MEFTATVEATGANTTGIEVPEDVMEQLGGKRVPVRVTINGQTYATTVGSMGGRSLISVSAAQRKACGVVAGDVVQVTVERDDAPREVAVPPELAAALAANPGAKQAFDALSNSKKQRLTLPVENGKTEATRLRNVDKAIVELTKSTT